MREVNVSGKGVFIWKPINICGGNPVRIADELVKANVKFVSIKIHNGWYVYRDIGPVIKEIRKRGIKVGGWGYIYLKYNPTNEALAAAEACDLYEPDFYLIDAEADAKYQFAAAKVFAPLLRKSLPAIPIGMCSYWKPSYHRELPWDALRAECDFDAPQVYWRGYLPVGKLHTSMKEYKLFSRKLPFSIAGGDMYFEHNMKPTPQQVTDFLAAAEKEPEIKGVLMWSMDQMSKAPELWKAFSDYKWAEAAASPVFPREAFLAKRVVLSEGGKITIVGETPTHYITQMYFDRPYIQGG